MVQKTKMLYWSWPTTMGWRNMIREMLMHRYIFFHSSHLNLAVLYNNTSILQLAFFLLLHLWSWLFSFQIAISTDDVYKTAEAIRVNGGKITREPGPLPGINTKITACTDPDGWKTVCAFSSCFSVKTTFLLFSFPLWRGWGFFFFLKNQEIIIVSGYKRIFVPRWHVCL